MIMELVKLSAINQEMPPGRNYTFLEKKILVMNFVDFHSYSAYIVIHVFITNYSKTMRLVGFN